MTEILLHLLIASSILYLLQTFFIIYGTHKLQYPKTAKTPKISILVALKDEERTVTDCVQTLLELDYPKDCLEIILINDRSSDATPTLIENLKSKSAKIRTLHIKTGLPGLSGKANAIAQAMDTCSGDIVLVTDGDCRVPKNWAKTHVSYYRDEVGLVGGFTLLDQKNDKTDIFGKIQSLDWAYLQSVGMGFMGFGIPLSVLGNNFSFRHQAYEQVGGYRNMGFTIIEDFALMKTLLKKTSWKVCYSSDTNMLVYSHPMPNLKHFYHQRKRWSAGGKEVGIYGKFLMLIAFTVQLLIAISFLLGKVEHALLTLVTISVADLGLLFRTTGLVQRRDLLKYFLPWRGFYFVYTFLFTPVLLLPTTVKWKDISYTWKFNWKLKRMTD